MIGCGKGPHAIVLSAGPIVVQWRSAGTETELAIRDAQLCVWPTRRHSLRLIPSHLTNRPIVRREICMPHSSSIKRARSSWYRYGCRL